MLAVSFYQENRQALYEKLPEGSAAVVFAGSAPRQSADAYYPFFANRNFTYLTGMEEEQLVLLAVKRDGQVQETIYLQPADAMAERWFGRRIHEEEARERYGFARIADVERFSADFERLALGGAVTQLWLDFDRGEPEEAPNEAGRFAQRAAERYPFLTQGNLHPILRQFRTIKKPCEIEAIRQAVPITRAGILRMMETCRVGMKEYELKAEFDYALLKRGALSAFPPIICCGENNFCIHYYDYTGTVHDGDMVLNDVGAGWNSLCNDVSRAWPANGKFTERQKALYQCIYNTSEYMFSLIKPGMPMASVDKTARRYCFEQLKALGLIDDFKDIRKLMWHDGAHHIGFDVHDVVNYDCITAPGMVFCVDIGVYCQEWGVGFRIEDNCLVTETGCENLTRSIPRTVEEIEAILAKR